MLKLHDKNNIDVYIKNDSNNSSITTTSSSSCDPVRLLQNELGQFDLPFIVTLQIYI